jgi:hypothetical protein
VAEAAMARCGGYHLVTAGTKGATDCPVTPCQNGAGDRNRTGDVQLGNFLRARHAVSLLHILHRLAGPRARDASHDFPPLLTRDGQYRGQYGLPEPVSRCPTVAADPGRARSAEPPRLARCPRNFGALAADLDLGRRRSRPVVLRQNPVRWPRRLLFALYSVCPGSA